METAIKALAKAQTEMGRVLKNSENPHLKKKYADLGAVIDACFSALHTNGFAVMQPCGADERGQFVDTILAHASGELFTSRVYLIVDKQDMQRMGSAITYARRYGLLGMAGLAPEDDDGEATKAPRPAQSKPAAVQTPPGADLRDKMIRNLRAKGAGLAEVAGFKADLAELQKLSPEYAAQVEAEIQTQKAAA